MANKKASGNASNKKAPSKTSSAKKSVKGNGSSGQASYDKKGKGSAVSSRKSRSTFAKVAPYLMMIFALALAVCFVIVQLLGLDDGAGVVGYYIQLFFCGLFGGAAFALPLVLGYVGVKWCIYNVRWKESGSSDEQNKARRRLVLQGVMSLVSLVMIASIIGVIADTSYFDIAAFWSDGAALVGGGVLGGMLGYLFSLCFEMAVSLIILIPITLIFIIISIGITPDYIVSKLQSGREERAAERAKQQAEEEEYEKFLAEEEEKIRREERRQAAALAAKKAKEERDAKAREEAEAAAKRAAAMSVDEMMDIETDERPAPVKKDSSDGAIDEFFAAENAKKAAEPKKKQKKNAFEQNDEILDFGGDSAFDTNEFKGLNQVMDSMKGTPYPAAREEKKPEPKPEPKPVENIVQGVPEKKERAAKPLDLTKMSEEEISADMAGVAVDESDGKKPEVEAITPYVFPPVDLLAKNKEKEEVDHTAELQENAKRLVETLRSFKVGVQSITYSRGPTITRYELRPEVGTRVKAIANLVDDIALSLATSGVRIEAPIPNKPAVGIEVPNRERATVYLRDLVENQKFAEAKNPLTSCLGMDVAGNPVYFDISKMPHLLIAGTTGSGKSVCINTIILSILYKTRPDEVKLILVDPKQVEFTVYENIPHLYCPIVSDPKKAAGALASAVSEMERRFELIKSVGVRNIDAYNEITANDPEKEYMPKMVIIIDELADLMMTARDDVETSICRLAQKARAAGIHVILGTQRPSVDVITGLIKANIPSRIACTVTSQVDSRTIIDVAGAENLIGRGDMLFAPVGSAKPMRVQCAFVSDGEVEQIISFIKSNNGAAKYNSDFIKNMEEEAAKCGQGKKGGVSIETDESELPEGGDSKFRDAVKLAIETGKISTSLMQRRLGVGYGRAAKIIDTMEQMGYVSAPDGNKPRQVLITMDEYMRRVTEGNLGEMEE